MKGMVSGIVHLSPGGQDDCIGRARVDGDDLVIMATVDQGVKGIVSDII